MANADNVDDVDEDFTDIVAEYLDKSRLRNQEFSSQTQLSNDADPSTPESKENNNRKSKRMNVEFVKISAQGAFLLWKKKDVLSHDWLLAAMVRQPQMAIMSGDEFYIDVDPIALRFIYGVLQGIMQASDLQSLTNMEIILIKNTAEYLLCPNVAKIIESTEKQFDLLKEENRKLQTKVKETNKRDDLLHIECGSMKKAIRANEERIHRHGVDILQKKRLVKYYRNEVNRLHIEYGKREFRLSEDLALMMKKKVNLERKVRGSGRDKDHKKEIAERWKY